VAGASPVGSQSLHPTQIYESVFGLALFFFLNNRLEKPHQKGAVFAQYLMFYGAFRFGVDFIRYYENSANFWINQIIALGLIAVGVLILINPFKKKS
jgi:phosphatidylglycerol:prolipoprotein diacylglycerol transferase